MIFFIAGMGTLLKKRLYEGCKISPKQFMNIYQKNMAIDIMNFLIKIR